MIDEAHQLGSDALEQVRLLTNLEQDERKLLQILLIGRPPLLDLLALQSLRQVSQRIVARFCLGPLGPHEVMPYVHHRLTLAGGSVSIISTRLGKVLHALSRGIPRTINLLCDRALLDASLQGVDRLDVGALAQAAHALGLEDKAAAPWERAPLAIAAPLLVAACAAAVILAHSDPPGFGTKMSEQVRSALDGEVGGTGTRRRIEQVAELTESQDAQSVARIASSQTTGAVNLDGAGSGLRGLMQHWGLDHRAVPGHCADFVGEIRCLSGRGGIGELLVWNLPAVLHLKDRQGHRSDAVLLAIEGDSVRLRTDAGGLRLSRSALAAIWHGDYTLLWRAPPGFSGPLHTGSRGAPVDWLRKHLSLWRGQMHTPSRDEPFDEELQAQVRAFQASEGLTPDGIAGARTLIRLATRTDPTLPTLAWPSGSPAQ